MSRQHRQCRCDKPMVYGGSDESLCANCGGGNPFPASNPVSGPVLVWDEASEDTRCLRCDVYLSEHASVESCAKFVAATEDHGDPATWSDENLVARGGVVEGAVLPERPNPYTYLGTSGGSNYIQAYPADVAETHFTLLETKLSEAIAQRDAARKEVEQLRESDRAVITQVLEVAQEQRARAEVAEAALATERARALQDLKRVWSVCWTLAGTDSESHMNFTSEENAVGWRDGLASAGARKIVLTEMAILGIQK